MDVSLFFAGTAGSVPTARRGLPALLLRAGGERILIDCGEGTQQQLLRSVGLPDLGAVFVTHFHLDHWLGLPGMIKSFELRDRDRETLFAFVAECAARHIVEVLSRMAGEGIGLEDDNRSAPADACVPQFTPFAGGVDGVATDAGIDGAFSNGQPGFHVSLRTCPRQGGPANIVVV